LPKVSRQTKKSKTMKKLIATVLAFGALNLMQAQQATTPAPAQQQPGPGGPKNRPTPEQIATRHSNHLQKTLGLTDDQKQKTYQAILTRTTAMQQIRAKYGPDGDKKAMHAEIKPVREQFVQTMDGILTPDQKTKWTEERQKVKENRMKRRQENGGNNGAAPASGTEPGKVQKLNSDDDGIDD
jgi:Spy/CpxP family protein refolding chaperone